QALTSEEQYTELLEPISEPHQLQQNDSNVISTVASVEQSVRTVKQNPATVEETHAYFESLYNNLAIEETLQLAQESSLKMKQLNKEIKPANYAKINQLSEVFVSQKAKSHEELYFSNTSKMASVSKSISIPNEEFSDDTFLSVARKFLNEVKTTIVTLQRGVKQKMILDIHNWSSTTHQELHKIVKDANFPILNQVDARVQNFEIQFLKEAAKFVQDFKSLAKEADESLAKHKALEYKIERLLRDVVSKDIMLIVQSNSVVDTLNFQTELERTKERYENCIIKMENEYAKLWNDWYKNVKNANMTKFHTIKLIMTCNKRSNGCKLSWEISRQENQRANVSESANKKKHKPNVKKSKKLGFEERHASPRPRNLELALGGYQLEEFLTLVEK
ncbi:hypothetical protein Tco_0723031, partial [Tanacetum coccineum]